MLGKDGWGYAVFYALPIVSTIQLMMHNVNYIQSEHNGIALICNHLQRKHFATFHLSRFEIHKGRISRAFRRQSASLRDNQSHVPAWQSPILL